MSDVIDRLWEVLRERRAASADTSYVASLHEKGLNKILEKVGEESTEVILAAKDVQKDVQGDNGKDAVIYEVADLWFHTMVLLDHLDLTPDEVHAELERRFGTSGIAEKNARSGS